MLIKKKMFEGKKILITGGTGSFGNEFLKTLLKIDCNISIFSRDELKQDEMRNKLKNKNIKFVIGDVRNKESVDSVMRGVDFVFHAAALKQVPSCEFFPLEAVATNIQGSANVIKSAIENETKKIVCLSTDKAVYPINAMGMSKAIMEKIVQAEARNISDKRITLSTVRYGNVMCSRGSVIPLFINQILSSKKITITDPTMTRFLLPLPEAINLVLFAFNNGNQGDLLIRKSPACNVLDLAQALLNLFNSSSKLDIIGIRHGEKIYETLATAAELKKSKSLENYFSIKSDERDLNYEKYFSEGKQISKNDYTSHNTNQLNIKQIEKLLMTLPYVKNILK
tara:strand:- start:12540 stop:13556 length:1017 start_codon:yes stop_codon:yes gene_type:complete